MPKRASFQLMAGITVTLVLMLGANLWMVLRQQQQDLLHLMHDKAQVVAQQLIATRRFMAENQDKINRSALGHFEFKGLNPAAVGRGVGDILRDSTGMRIKQTRLRPRRSENAPDEFELEALRRFEKDRSLKEFWKQVEENGEPFFRYAVPLYIEKECLACHGGPPGETDVAGYLKEGYKEGDLGGAISVALPMSEAMDRIWANAMKQVWVIIGVTSASLLVIWLLSRYLVASPLERLAAAAARIGSGQMEITPAELKMLSRSRELQVVGQNMETMARNLRDLYNHLEEKVAERTRELQQANELQSQFLATVSHELRTPLTSIIAFTELLLKQADGQQREYLEDVLDSSRRLLEMVDNLLDFSRLKAGRIELFTDLVEVDELITDVERALRPLAARKNVRLLVADLPELPLVLVDPLRVRQVLVNLVSNGIKFTPEGGTVTVGAQARDGWVEVWVRDTGPGIPEAQRDLIFEAFRRVEAPGLNKPGSGLGLAIARNLVEMHGGQIWVEDAPGGALFRFTLPAPKRHPGEEEDGLADQ